MKKAIIPKAESGMIKVLVEELASAIMDLFINQLIARLPGAKPRSLYAKPQFVKIPTLKGFIMFRVSDILRIETHSSYAKKKGIGVKNGDGNSTHIFTKWGGHFRMARKICDWKKMLEPGGDFLQTHQSHLVNSHHIRQVYDEDGTVVELVNGHTVPVSGKFKVAVLNSLLENPGPPPNIWDQDDDLPALESA